MTEPQTPEDADVAMTDADLLLIARGVYTSWQRGDLSLVVGAGIGLVDGFLAGRDLKDQGDRVQKFRDAALTSLISLAERDRQMIADSIDGRSDD